MQAAPAATRHSCAGLGAHAYRPGAPAYNPGALPRGPLRVPAPQKHARRYAPSLLSDDASAASGAAKEAPPPPRDDAWFAHRRASCRFLALVGVAAAVLAGLALGLAVGLRRR